MHNANANHISWMLCWTGLFDWQTFQILLMFNFLQKFINNSNKFLFFALVTNKQWMSQKIFPKSTVKHRGYHCSSGIVSSILWICHLLCFTLYESKVFTSRALFHQANDALLAYGVVVLYKWHIPRVSVRSSAVKSKNFPIDRLVWSGRWIFWWQEMPAVANRLAYAMFHLFQIIPYRVPPLPVWTIARNFPVGHRKLNAEFLFDFDFTFHDLFRFLAQSNWTNVI